MNNRAYEDRPRVLLHPPSLLCAALIIGFAIRAFVGGYMPLPHLLTEGAGGVLILCALAIVISAISAFAEGGETLKPDTPSKQLFVNGPYRYSRNPIYLAMMLFGAGFGLATSNLWIVLTTVFAGLLLHFFVILPEERYLTDKFGEEYETYKSAVRRWI